jgi:ubiquinone/menaquinone biosynthesis C-methylase UbiE
MHLDKASCKCLHLQSLAFGLHLCYSGCAAATIDDTAASVATVTPWHWRARKGMDHRGFFDEAAAKWDSLETPETFARLREIVGGLGIMPGASVLDVGCGTGVLFPILVESTCAQGRIVALDISGEMLRYAQAKGYPIACVQGDAQCLPLAEAVFDWVICNGVLPHFPNKVQALRELRRALRDDGTLVICHANSWRAINAIHRSIGGVVAHDMVPDPDTVKNLLRQAHMRLVEIVDASDRYLAVARRDHA